MLTEWPQRIDAQVLRTRLAAFKMELCDENFQERPCAVCCRLKRRCKLFDVVFPVPDADRPPAWLPWDAEQWLTHRAAWYSSVDKLLNIDNYLENFFRTGEKLLEARKEVLAFQEDSGLSSSFVSLAAAESWVRRVETWIANLRRDLETDSLPAPGNSGARWLLFPSEYARIDAATGETYYLGLTRVKSVSLSVCLFVVMRGVITVLCCDALCLYKGCATAERLQKECCT